MKFRAHFSRTVTLQALGFIDFEMTAEELAEGRSLEDVAEDLLMQGCVDFDIVPGSVEYPNPAILEEVGLLAERKS